jgi:flavorubredoxin
MDVYASDAALPIVDGKVYAVGGTVEHRGHISWVPAGAAGYAPLNAYVLTEGRAGLMIDTSLPVFEDAIVTQLKGLGLDELTIVLTRSVEFDSMGNAEVIAAKLPVKTIYAQMQYPPTAWCYMREDEPELTPPATYEERMFGYEDSIDLAPGRHLTLVDTKLKLLACAWVFDHATGTLFTSDSFSHVLAPDPYTRVITEDNDHSTVEDVQRHLLTKFEWLMGARTDPVRTFLDRVFTRFDVQAIAPLGGCVLHGRAVVARHRALVDEALSRISERREVAA